MTEPLYCVNHPNTVAHFRCRKCKQPICTECRRHPRQMLIPPACPDCARAMIDGIDARVKFVLLMVVVSVSFFLIGLIITKWLGLPSAFTRSYDVDVLVFALQPILSSPIGRVVLVLVIAVVVMFGTFALFDKIGFVPRTVRWITGGILLGQTVLTANELVSQGLGFTLGLPAIRLPLPPAVLYTLWILTLAWAVGLRLAAPSKTESRSKSEASTSRGTLPPARPTTLSQKGMIGAAVFVICASLAAEPLAVEPMLVTVMWLVVVLVLTVVSLSFLR